MSPKIKFPSKDERIEAVIKQEVDHYIELNLSSMPNKNTKRIEHICLNCKGYFYATNRYHSFCGRSCYSKFHRIPGFIRKLIKERK